MIITATPFRVSFFGGGTDYPIWYRENGGCVLSTSINKFCYLTSRYLPPFFEHKHRIAWSKIETVSKIEDIQHPAVAGALRMLNLDKGMEIHHASDLPARAGLGSSSSFAVGLLYGLHALEERYLDHKLLAQEAIRLEQDILHENVGVQDQIAAAYGGLNKISIETDGNFTVEPIMLSLDRRKKLFKHCMLYFTGIVRTASELAAEKINAIPKRKDTLHRLQAMVEEGISLLNGTDSLQAFGELLDEGWRLKRSISSSISNNHIDEIYETARNNGAYGGKLLGAGGGGFILIFAPPENQPRIRKALSGLLEVPFEYEGTGVRTIAAT